MKRLWLNRISNIFNKIDKSLIFLALGITLSISYYFNPLDGVDLTTWDRTFSSSILSGISIDRRIENFYGLFFLKLPLVFIFVTILLTCFFIKRRKYKDYCVKYGIFTFFSTVASLFSRYSADSYTVVDNPLMQVIIGFWILIIIIGFCDKDEVYGFADIVLTFAAFVTFCFLLMILFNLEQFIHAIIISGLVISLYSVFVVKYKGLNKYVPEIKAFIYLILWLPALIRIELEGIYFLTEKGGTIYKYLTHVSRVTVVIIIAFMILSVFAAKKKKDLCDFGYIGFIASICSLSYFAYTYQYTWSFGDFTNIYELGNCAVAADSILYGKLPIIDYFSAHALNDVWTSIIYCLIHGDLNGILVNPYGGLTNMVAFIFLYFIIKKIFNQDLAIMYVILFPGLLIGIKWISLCSLSILMLIFIDKKSDFRRYLLFWLLILICAFITYDEGISLGIACILAYLIFEVIDRKWKDLRYFIGTGIIVGGIAIFAYLCYGLVTGVPLISRIREWLSVSVGSNSSWATTNFGDQTSFAFFVSYFAVPVTAVLLMIFVIYRYSRRRMHRTIALICVAFSITEVLFIARTIVYHNLAICSGWTGVLLNFIHWTVAFYVLYVSSEKKLSDNLRVFAWMGAMILVILIESTVVTHYWPSSDSVLLSKGIRATEEWELTNSITSNIGQKRIIYDENSTVLVNQFRKIFDILLTDDQTFLDFANVTSMYLLTNRRRPCYVGQSPSMLTDLYSQECFLNEISEYECPLVVVGMTETSHLAQMVGVPHNIRYYKIAEYIYSNYRPLVSFGEIAIWCDSNCYELYRKKLEDNQCQEMGYSLIDYGYDFTSVTTDENGNTEYVFCPYHSYDLEMIPYIWANYDEYSAADNSEMMKMTASEKNVYRFAGSQSMDDCGNGNYLSFSCTNSTEDEIKINIIFYDSNNEGAMAEYYFTVLPGTNSYLIRVSGDYFWNIFNIDTILFGNNETVSVGDLKILEGD